MSGGCTAGVGHRASECLLTSSTPFDGGRLGRPVSSWGGLDELRWVGRAGVC